MRNVFASVLAARNVDVVQVESGCQALIALEREDVDLACIALELGDMHAADLLQCNRANQRGNVLPFVAITSNRDKTHVDAALAAGFSECFHKSRLADFETYVDTWLGTLSRKLSGNVLLIEDSVATAQFCTQLMNAMGLVVDSVPSAELAIDALSHRRFTLVVTDFMLSGLQTGLDVIRFLRSRDGRPGRTPILALSGNDNMSRRIEILRAGANDYVQKPVLPEELEVRLRNLITLAELFDRLEAQHEMVKDMAQRDRLTGLFNRHRLEELMPDLIANAHKTGAGLSLVVLDLDHFKQINDAYGHAGGDQVLIAVAAALRGTSRPQDIAVRYGGEELLLLLPGIDLPRASLGAERLRRHIENSTRTAFRSLAASASLRWRPTNVLIRCFAAPMLLCTKRSTLGAIR